MNLLFTSERKVSSPWSSGYEARKASLCAEHIYKYLNIYKFIYTDESHKARRFAYEFKLNKLHILENNRGIIMRGIKEENAVT